MSETVTVDNVSAINEQISQFWDRPRYHMPVYPI